ncbi:MAG: DUF4112 domain-containing protein [Novosphingobium sp.]|uniref:DUF4112 domain-containing protein n=1 Tax=Novosphingobium sp. TaxID=1874826 RepID=UPI0032B7CF23
MSEINTQDKLRRMTAALPTGTDPQSVRQRVEALERLLEGLIEVPLLGRKVGLDALVGLVPGIGDAVTAAMGLYLVWEARNLDMPRWQVWRMLGNVGIDALVGAVPVAGDLFDFLYRSNTKNLKIIRKHLDRHHPHTRVIEG